MRETVTISDVLIQEGRQRAEQILLANGGELGLLGSNQAYQQVWARDSMICVHLRPRRRYARAGRFVD